jgi:hypothetical protein
MHPTGSGDNEAGLYLEGCIREGFRVHNRAHPGPRTAVTTYPVQKDFGDFHALCVGKTEDDRHCYVVYARVVGCALLLRNCHLRPALPLPPVSPREVAMEQGVPYPTR